jgi:hypothetical protein
MSSRGAAARAAVPATSTRAETSRLNGAKSRGPKTPEGKARSAQNALKHGMRAQKYLVLPDEDAAEFEALEAALVEELAPVGALQTVLARRVAVAAWRLARADRIETELFEERRTAGGGLGLALIRDGNGARSFDTLLRYRGAAMAEFWRALRALKALQAEPTGTRPVGASASRPEIVPRLTTNEPERCPQHRLDRLIHEPSRGLHESPAIWQPNEPEPMPANPPRRLSRGPAHGRSDEPGLAGMRNEVGQADPGPHAIPEISAGAGRTARAS